MSLIKWRPSHSSDPFGELVDFQKTLNRLFDASGELKSFWGPAVDIYEEKDSIRIKADLPGLKEEEIDVSINDGVLIIRGERKNENEKKAHTDLRHHFGS